jgi:hypothetical protein
LSGFGGDGDDVLLYSLGILRSGMHLAGNIYDYDELDELLIFIS